MVPPTKLSLLDAVKNLNDAEAWKRLVSVYGPVVYRYCRRSGLQDSDAQDVTQVVFVKLREKLPEFEYNANLGRFRSFLYKIVRGKIRDFRRANQRREALHARVQEELQSRGAELLGEVGEHIRRKQAACPAAAPSAGAVESDDEVGLGVFDDGDDEDSEWEAIFYSHLLDTALNELGNETGGLSPTEYQFVQLWWEWREDFRDVEKLNHHIASELDLSVKTIPALKSRSFDKIRDRLKELAGECPRFLLEWPRRRKRRTRRTAGMSEGRTAGTAEEDPHSSPT